MKTAKAILGFVSFTVLTFFAGAVTYAMAKDRQEQRAEQEEEEETERA